MGVSSSHTNEEEVISISVSINLIYTRAQTVHTELWAVILCVWI